jgi:hypothetical protein
MLSKRSITSLCQFIGIQDVGTINVLLKKHNLLHYWNSIESIVHPLDSGNVTHFLQSSLLDVEEKNLHDLLAELIKTRGALRSQISPKYLFDERLKDLEHCLQLDGYLIEGNEIKTVQPVIGESSTIEDDLTATIDHSNLPRKQAIIDLIKNSAQAFTLTPQSYNDCMSNARIALETLVKDITEVRHFIPNNHSGEYKWGHCLQWLRQASFISVKQEEGLSGVYTFISHGLHNPIGLDEAEVARLGRTLSLNMCYFLIKSHVATHS